MSLGRIHVPARTWIRASAAAYAMMILLPAGRIAGEVARATLVARHVGGARAATASTILQATYMFANGALSAATCVVLAPSDGLRSPLVALLVGNAVLMSAACAGLLAVLRHGRVGPWLEKIGRLMPAVSSTPPLEPGGYRRIPWRQALACTASRFVQVAQYGLVVVSVGGAATVRAAFVAHGIHLVGTTAGDLVPNQLGVVDGVYRAFAGTLGFADAPARAVSIAFIVHIAQLACAAACILTATLMREAQPVNVEARRAFGADARS
jgi:uncharacterized membrane protein YbhN (UPF0104 family)